MTQANAPDQVTAALAKIRERNEHWIKTMALTGASVEDSPFGDNRLLVAAVRDVLKLADGAYVMLANHETGQREPVAWDLDPEALRDAISEALLGSQAAPAGEGQHGD